MTYVNDFYVLCKWDWNSITKLLKQCENILWKIKFAFIDNEILFFSFLRKKNLCIFRCWQFLYVALFKLKKITILRTSYNFYLFEFCLILRGIISDQDNWIRVSSTWISYIGSWQWCVSFIDCYSQQPEK